MPFVLVTDFYAAYDGIDCPQQKCLIHLMRDLNDDLLKYPFNEELKGIGKRFVLLLKPIIETVDQFGLKTGFLRRHKLSVEDFYKRLSCCNYKTDTAIYYKERFEKKTKIGYSHFWIMMMSHGITTMLNIPLKHLLDFEGYSNMRLKIKA